MEMEKVPPAYAQSLFAANLAIEKFGFGEIRRFMDRLKNGESKDTAFYNAFGKNESAFEDDLFSALREWQARHREK